MNNESSTKRIAFASLNGAEYRKNRELLSLMNAYFLFLEG